MWDASGIFSQKIALQIPHYQNLAMQTHGIQEYSLPAVSTQHLSYGPEGTFHYLKNRTAFWVHYSTLPALKGKHRELFLGLRGPVNHLAWPPTYYRPKEKSFCKSRTTLSAFRVVNRRLGILTQLPKMSDGASRMKAQHSRVTLPLVQDWPSQQPWGNCQKTSYKP